MNASIKDDKNLRLHTFIKQRLSNNVRLVEKVQWYVLYKIWQFPFDNWGAPRQTVDPSPSFWRLGQDFEHVLARNAICACNDGSEALYMIRKLGQAMEDVV